MSCAFRSEKPFPNSGFSREAFPGSTGVEGVDDTDVSVELPVAEVFGKEFFGSAGLSGGEDHGIPEGELPAFLKGEAEA